MTDPRRRTFGPVVLLGLVAGTLTAVAGDHRAVSGSGKASSASTGLLVRFDGHMPLVTALGLVVLACWGVVLVTRGKVRRAVAALALVGSVGALVAVLSSYRLLTDDLRDQLAEVGISNPDLSHTAWYWAALVGALLSVVAGVLAVRWCPGWPEMGSRYDAPGTTPETPAAPPEEQSSLDLWKAMDEGHDPTA